MKSLLDFFLFLRFVSPPPFFNVLHFDGDDVVISGLIFCFVFLCFRHDLYDTHMFRCFELVLVFPLVDFENVERRRYWTFTFTSNLWMSQRQIYHLAQRG